MTDDRQLQNQQNRMARLLQKRKEVLAMPPEKALNAILESEEALPLVHSFAEEDLYFLVHDIGPADALPILALASAKQWEYILDLEVWQKDRIIDPEVFNWMELLLQADPVRTTAWLRDEKTDLLEHYLFRNISIMLREHDQDPSDFGEDCITFDDLYYFRIPDQSKQDQTQAPADEHRREVLLTLLNRLAESDHLKYQKILLEAAAVLPAELEEEMYRLRNIRLAEKGFLPFEEALGIYQPLTSAELANSKNRQVYKNGRELTPLALAPSLLLTEDNLFARAVKAIHQETMAHQVRIEFAALCNRIVSADQTIVKARETLQNIVQKAGGYLSIGLWRLTTDYIDGPVEVQAAAMLGERPLAEIFRTGYDRIMQLKYKAEKWKNQSWFMQAGLPLSFWGERRLGVLGGLLLKRPLYYDHFKTGRPYREFAGPADIHRSESVLQELMAYDRLLTLLGQKIPAELARRAPTFADLLLTNWVQAHLDLPKTVAIPLERFKDFYQELFADNLTEVPARGHSGIHLRKIRPAMKQAFLVWLMNATGLGENEILADLSAAFEELFNDIENEYGAVTMENLDPRFIHLFLVE